MAYNSITTKVKDDSFTIQDFNNSLKNNLDFLHTQVQVAVEDTGTQVKDEALFEQKLYWLNRG